MWGFVQDVCFRWSLCFSHPPGPGLQRGLGRPTSWRPVQRAAALSWLEGDKVVAEILVVPREKTPTGAAARGNP